MFLKKSILFLLSIWCIYSVSFAQSVDRDISSELFNVDFNALNSVPLNQLEMQANILYLQGDYQGAAKTFLKIINYNIDDVDAYYKLSCCYARLQNPEYAGNFLVMAVNAGFTNFSIIKNEESYQDIRSNELFARTIKEVLDYGENYGQTVYNEVKVMVKSRYFLPNDYDSTKKYHLLIGLHGYGGTAEDFVIINKWLNAENFIVVIPEAPYLKDEIRTKKLGYSWDFRFNNQELWKTTDPAVMDYIMNVYSYFNNHYNIDKNYLLGFSQGAAYAYATGIKNSDKIDAVIACGGRFPDIKKYPWFLSEEDLVAGKETRICIIHGDNDLVIDYKKSLKAKRLLSRYDYDVNFISFRGGHKVDPNSLNEAIQLLEDKN